MNYGWILNLRRNKQFLVLRFQRYQNHGQSFHADLMQESLRIELPSAASAGFVAPIKVR